MQDRPPQLARPLDAGPFDAGPLDAGPFDAGPLDAGPSVTTPRDAPPQLTGRERAVYAVLDAHRGRVLSRQEIARRAGIVDLGQRRCDALISGIRRGGVGHRIVTVRGRGWMLTD